MIVYLQNLCDLFVDMSFYIVLGLVFTGLLHAFVKKEVILKHIGKNNMGSVVKAAVFGVPLPLCSCSVVPTAMYLGKSGASKGAVISFLTSTPQTGVDSLIATYGMLGPLFAVYRAVAAFVSGVFSGVITNVICKNDTIHYDTAPTSCGCTHAHQEAHGHEHHHADTACDCTVHQHHHAHTCAEEDHHGGCGCSEEPVAEHHAPTCTEQEAHHHACACGCSGEQAAEQPATFTAKLNVAFSYAFGDFLDEIALHFVVGLLIAALISTVLPTSLLSNLNSPILTMLLMIVIGVPMYICSTASIPIAVSLILKGVSPGAAFVFLFCGPVTNIASLTILIKTLGRKVTVLYMGLVALCAVVFGLLLDAIIELLGGAGIQTMLTTSQEEGNSIYMTVVAILFGVLVLNSLSKRFRKKAAR